VINSLYFIRFSCSIGLFSVIILLPSKNSYFENRW